MRRLYGAIAKWYPKVHLRDYTVVTDLDKDYKDSKLNIEVDVTKYEDVAGNYKVNAILAEVTADEAVNYPEFIMPPIHCTTGVKLH